MSEGIPSTRRWRGYLVHLFTASGLVPAFFTAASFSGFPPTGTPWPSAREEIRERLLAEGFVELRNSVCVA